MHKSASEALAQSEKAINLDVDQLTAESRYPLRGLPLQMSEDFDAPMSELWESLGE